MIVLGNLRLTGKRSAIVPRTYGGHWGRAVRVPHRSLEVSYFVCLAMRRNQSNLGMPVFRNESACLCLLAWLLHFLGSDKLAYQYPSEILLNAKLI